MVTRRDFCAFRLVAPAAVCGGDRLLGEHGVFPSHGACLCLRRTFCYFGLSMCSPFFLGGVELWMFGVHLGTRLAKKDEQKIERGKAKRMWWED